MDLEQSITLSPDVMAQEVNGETVLLDLKSEYYFGLNDVGTKTWQLLSEGKNLRAALEALLTEFEVDETTLTADITRLVSDLAEQGLIELPAIT